MSEMRVPKWHCDDKETQMIRFRREQKMFCSPTSFYIFCSICPLLVYDSSHVETEGTE